MTTRTREQALKALDGMRSIVRKEMLITGQYVEAEVTNQRLANNGSICGGHRHCALGSLWVGAGIKAVIFTSPDRHFRTAITLPGVSTWVREDFLRYRPALRAAYDALNEAALAFADRQGLRLPLSYYEAPLEALFEGHYGTKKLTKRDLLTVIASARRRLLSVDLGN